MSQSLRHGPDEDRVRRISVQGKLPGNTAHTRVNQSSEQVLSRPVPLMSQEGQGPEPFTTR
jgi:hypothetical protein